MEWLNEKLNRIWHNHPQPPDYYFSLHTLVKKVDKMDSRLAALRTTRASIELPDKAIISLKELLSSPQQATATLSKMCMLVFEGHKENKALCRDLEPVEKGLSDQQEVGRKEVWLEKSTSQT